MAGLPLSSLAKFTSQGPLRVCRYCSPLYAPRENTSVTTKVISTDFTVIVRFMRAQRPRHSMEEGKADGQLALSGRVEKKLRGPTPVNPARPTKIRSGREFFLALNFGFGVGACHHRLRTSIEQSIKLRRILPCRLAKPS